MLLQVSPSLSQGCCSLRSWRDGRGNAPIPFKQLKTACAQNGPTAPFTQAVKSPCL